MGNRSFLYLVSPNDADSEELNEIADANNMLPVLWEILLADGAVAPAIDYQRVFGDAGTDNISSVARRGLQRLRMFADYLRGHPRCPEIPALMRYLDAAIQHLAAEIDRSTGVDGQEPMFSANFDELSWLSADPPEEFIADCIAQFRQTWTALEGLIDARRYEGLEEVLGLHEWRIGFTEWSAWSTVFGLSLFQHPYFFGTWDEPREMPFEEFDPDDDDSYLGAGYVRFKANGLWGIRKEQDGPDGLGVISPPHWEKIKRASENEDATQLSDTERRCWVRRDGKYALMILDGPAAGQALTAAVFDEVWEYGSDGLCVAQQDGLMGHLRRDGRWYLQPAWQEVWDFDNGMALIAQDGLTGYMDAQGTTVFTPQFDEAFNFNAHGTACARLGTAWSLLMRDGGTAVDGCSTLEWRDDFVGWLAEKSGSKGLFHADGKPWLPIAYEEITAVGRQQSIVVKAEFAGLLDWHGHQRIPLRYHRLGVIQTFGDSAGDADFAVGLFVAEDDRRTTGLLNASGETVLPFEFASIHLFPPQQSPRARVEISHQFRVSLARTGATEPGYGVWDLRQNRLIVPCIYQHIWLVMLGSADRYGYYVATSNDRTTAKRMGKFAVRLLDANGKALFDRDFAWLGLRLSPTKSHAMEAVREAIIMAWSRGKTLPAAFEWSGPEVGLKADGSWTD